MCWQGYNADASGGYSVQDPEAARQPICPAGFATVESFEECGSAAAALGLLVDNHRVQSLAAYLQQERLSNRYQVRQRHPHGCFILDAEGDVPPGIWFNSIGGKYNEESAVDIRYICRSRDAGAAFEQALGGAGAPRPLMNCVLEQATPSSGMSSMIQSECQCEIKPAEPPGRAGLADCVLTKSSMRRPDSACTHVLCARVCTG